MKRPIEELLQEFLALPEEFQRAILEYGGPFSFYDGKGTEYKSHYMRWDSLCVLKGGNVVEILVNDTTLLGQAKAIVNHMEGQSEE